MTGPRAATITIGIGAAGGGLAFWAGLPAAWLVGGALAVTLAALGGVPTAVPTGLRNAAFALIGLSMGSGIDPETLRQAAAWPLSIALMGLCLATIMASGVWYLRRFGDFDSASALLAASPGALSNALALAAEGHGDVRRVALNQGVRLLILTAALPPILGALVIPVAAPAMPVPAPDAALGILILAGLAGGWVMSRLKVPAGFLLGAMLVSVAAHLGGLVHGQPPTWLLAPGFVVTGCAIGARFLGVTRRELSRGLGTGLIYVMAALLMSGGFAAAAAVALDLPLGQVWVAYAPGGVEAMSAMGLALGHDPAFIAVHHVLRILALSLALPVLIRLVSAR